MDEDDIAPDELFHPGHLLAGHAPVMGDELQVERGDPDAGVALARRCLADVADAALEGEVAMLDDIAQFGPIDRRRWQPHECGVTLELREVERGTQGTDDGVDEVGEDVLCVIELHAGKVAAVARDVSDDETGRFGAVDHPRSDDFGRASEAVAMFTRRLCQGRWASARLPRGETRLRRRLQPTQSGWRNHHHRAAHDKPTTHVKPVALVCAGDDMGRHVC
jgi:hypothetical protein